ncbi:MAG: hypothetical protein HYT34_01625 [Candidatus Ryanbacteria bacterium]|nr:hypothetical protein [Candidatus Ryanbacteria bacterium]
MGANTGPINRQSLLFLLLIVLLGATGFIWYRYLWTPAGSSLVVKETAPKIQNPKVAGMFEAIQTLRTISLDIEFFQDPRFTALQDFPTSIPNVKPSGGTFLKFYRSDAGGR